MFWVKYAEFVDFDVFIYLCVHHNRSVYIYICIYCLLVCVIVCICVFCLR